MNFLKKHYEKVVLLALFIIFALLLVHLYTIVQATGEVKESDLQIPTREPDYKVADVNAPMFNLPQLFSEKNSWSKSVAREQGSAENFTDIMEVFKIVRCGHCKYLIPRSVMEQQKNCPHCRKELLPPKAEEAGTQLAARLDSDEDGIPNLVELEFKLDPYDANDATLDLDDDGFVNVYEYEMGTDFTDPKKHPELCTGLRLIEIERQPLKAKLLGVTVIEGRGKESWSIQLETEEQIIRKKKRPLEKHYLFIGNRITLDTGIYTVSDIKVEKVTKLNDKKQKEEVNSGYIILKDHKNREIVMKVGEVAYDPDDKAYFKEVWSDKTYNGKVGSRFRMGNAKIGYTRYTVKSITKRASIGNSVVVLEAPVKGGKDIEIRDKTIMPVKYYPSKEKDKDKENQPQDAPEEAPAAARK